MTDTFVHQRQRLAYTTYGEGERLSVLLHGLLMSRRMHQPLAQALAQRGNRVVTLDLLGHGESDRPPDMWRYSMSLFAEQVVALLDHLEAREAVVGGTSLGANVTLETASLAPGRVRGMLLEMPVLDHALVAGATAFTPLMLALTFAEPLMGTIAAAARRVPHRALPFWVDVGLDIIRQEPGPSAAVIQGVLFGRIAPNRRERRRFTQPALVIGHHRDPVHPLTDAGMLVEELPDGRLLEASTVLELRLRPERLTREIGNFLDQCWERRGAGRTGSSRRAPVAVAGRKGS